ncbi:Small RNA 2'-O-methyltransferase [Heracleum sosnowskyi]|uniref:Small RNA 2'-O-methyltransferase n=1 Tax=Heracleum sosnowskyi TaxID=360622 RepID=A0AAD8HKQ9_9APIA|nr:Small RNA 2'-O-methyltransferase [Heracleum sosnowskyi]
MGSQETPAVALKKKTVTLTPKAIIHQKFGVNAVYKVEEVQNSDGNGCPGLNLSRKGSCLFRCSLQLPEVTVVSELCKKKKDAEHSAAEKAIEKLGINPTLSIPTAQEARDEVVGRLSYLFSDAFYTTVHPLSGHFRVALLRKDHLYGYVPVSVLSLFDSKLINLCKCINPEIESKPWLVVPLILEAAARVPLLISENHLSMRRPSPYPPEVVEAIDNSNLPERTCIKAVRVPCSSDKIVEPLLLNVSTNGYYLDVIAQELGVTDASKVLISRSVGKASSETRLYFSAPQSYMLNVSSDSGEEVLNEQEGTLNTRASYLSGQDIYGDAILAFIGYTWKSTDISYEDVSLRSYYRILINKTPDGVYKLSREAILAAELPVAFTTRSNWRGSYPRDILCTFCRQHRLSVPEIIPLENLEVPGLHKKLKLTDSREQETNGGGLAESVAGVGGTFKCEIKIFSRSQELVLWCTPKKSFKKQSDAIQDAALKILTWLNNYFKNPKMSVENLTASAHEIDIQFYPQCFIKEFELCQSVHNTSRLLSSDCLSNTGLSKSTIFSVNDSDHMSGISLSTGSLACISYSIYLLAGECMKELLERNEEFEFEIGVKAVFPHLEAVVTQMSVGQSITYNVEVLAHDLIMAAATDSERILSLLNSGGCSLEYSITLLRVTEPLEERMEQALFSPPLSKQRVEFALQQIRESCAASLIDFGCGSGSLLESLLAYPTSLEKVVGVDISQRSLARAAKILHTKLTTKTEAGSSQIKSAVLYDGSITTFDSRVYGFDIGTCLEVIEHMEEDQAFLFGDVVLRFFCPKVLIVSTPNFEYNVILHKSTVQGQEDDPDEKNQSQSSKFRNHDHKFEWTREQFNDWASKLAEKHNYSVTFSGVGGVDGVEPGYASQIAVFRRGGDNFPEYVNINHHYNVIWDWSSQQQFNMLKELK